MIKQTSRSSTRALIVGLSLTNLLVFMVGLSYAARVAVLSSPSVANRTGVEAAAVSSWFGAEPTPLPIEGKGMWIWQFAKVAGGDPNRIVQAALANGLTHIYVRSGSSRGGINGWPDVAKILPVAHEHGLKVIAWDFPELRDASVDVQRARWVLDARVNGHGVDGFAADVETKSEGTVLSRDTTRWYARGLRKSAAGAFLVLVAPPPNPFTTAFYPYDILVPNFDAVAPMVYWGSRAPDQTTAWAINYLKRFGKPVAPVGQAFDMGPEGGPKGAPQPNALVSFMSEAQRKGAVGVSFWSWQHTPAGLWRTIQSYPWPAKPGRE